MSFRLVKGSGAQLREKARIPASTTITKDAVLALDATNNGLIPATSSSTTKTIRAVAQEALASSGSASEIDVMYIEPGQLFEADCTNATNVNQLFKRHALTNSLTVNNSSTEATGPTGVVEMVKIISSSKALFRMIPSVVTA